MGIGLSSTEKADITGNYFFLSRKTIRAEALLNPLCVAAKKLESSHSQPKYVKVILFFTTDVNIGILPESYPIH